MGKRLITKLSFTHGDVINLGDEYDGHKVESISFRKDTHTTTGSAGCPCYVVKLLNTKVQLVVPRENIKYVMTDVNGHAVEDGAEVPELPED